MKNLKDYINESFVIGEPEILDTDLENYLNEHNINSKILYVTKPGEEIDYNEDIMGYLTEMSESVVDQIGEPERMVLEYFGINPDEVLCFKHTANEDDASETITYSKILESKYKTSDFDKTHNVIRDKNKLKKFVMDHESDFTEEGFGTDDVKDIMNVMTTYHSSLYSMSEEDPNNISQYIEDAEEILSDEADEDMVEIAMNLYSKLFKQLTGKKLDD